jgi:hypothetical protein
MARNAAFCGAWELSRFATPRWLILRLLFQ